ncbi:hypothetical protein J6590_081016 [Homalodisca vitripennis]|nr:hypothetical protein J6590_081016 [Homalodisca vitripennis]
MSIKPYQSVKLLASLKELAQFQIMTPLRRFFLVMSSAAVCTANNKALITFQLITHGIVLLFCTQQLSS